MKKNHFPPWKLIFSAALSAGLFVISDYLCKTNFTIYDNT